MPGAAGSTFEATLAARGAMVEAWLRDRVARFEAPSNLREAIEYALFGGGKYLRPALCVVACEACGGDPRDALPSGAAVELVHAFSLVHDDLPAMDDDDLRRGRPTLHVRSGEAMAILAGDAMLAQAFGVLARESSGDALARALIAELAQASGAMIAGQVYDTVGDLPAESAEAAVRRIHTHKTGALIRAACRMGALAAGADHATLRAITTYGERVGLMFQIVDDLVDVEQTEEHAGKRTGKDAGLGKRTYPEAVGVRASRDAVARLCDEAVAALAPLAAGGATLALAADHLARRTR